MSSQLKQAIDKVLSDDTDVREATASHQEEFPYERDNESQVTRREFCNFLFLTSTTLFVSAGGFAAKAVYDGQAEAEFAPMLIEDGATLGPGSSLNFRYPGENDTAILIRTRSGEYRAFTQKCTHLTCPVYFAKERNRLECPCHDGGFDVETGAVLYGPPPRPLDKIELEVTPDGAVWATGIRRSGEHDV
jgi:Rieske Fe-S protein